MIVLIVSHVHVLREALVDAFRGEDNLKAYGAFSRDSVAAVIAEFPPSLVVVDSSHPEGASLVAAIRASIPKLHVIVIATRERDEEFLAWADVGISGYLGPDTSTRDLVTIVRRAEAGEVVCPPRLTALLLNRFASRSEERTTRAGIYALTAREREIAELLAAGMSNKLIARRLQVALPTVKNHVHSILDKWDVRSRGEAAARYRQKIQEHVEPSATQFTPARTSNISQMNGSTLRNGELRSGGSSSFGYRAA
jgi:two-component system nitrate/nitrite response regulator NarL